MRSIYKLFALILLTLVVRVSTASANTYSYDAQGRIVAVVYDDGSRLVYAYDANSNLISVTSASAGFADLSVTVQADANPAFIGEPLTYTIMVTNNGPDAVDNATVMDTLPAAAMYLMDIPSQGSCAGLGRNVDCDLGYMAVGASATIDIVVEPRQANAVNNVVTVSSLTTDPDSSNNSALVGTVYEDADTDTDGLFNSEELEATITGDGNNDGVPDHRQAAVASLLTGVNRGGVTIEVGGGCSSINMVGVGSSDLVAVRDTYYFPFGLAAFTLPCASADVTLYYSDSSDLSLASYRMYTPMVPGDAQTTDWFPLPAVTWNATDFGGGTLVASASFTLNDGELGDETGVDGAIVAGPGGPAFQKPGARVLPEIAWDSRDASLPFGIDNFIIYDLPFSFDFFGRTKDRISVNQHGLIELLGPGESCIDCEAPGTYDQGNHIDVMDAIFAGNAYQGGAVTIQGTPDSVEVLFMLTVEIYLPFTWDWNDQIDQLVSVTLYPDGRIQFRYFSFVQDEYGSRLFNGLYSKTGVELPIDELNNLGFNEPRYLTAYEYTPGSTISPLAWTEGDGFVAGAENDREMPLLIPFPFFARPISSIHVAKSGFVELLEAGETCIDCEGYLSHASDLPYALGYDALFAANDVLQGQTVVRRKSDGVDITWMGTTDADDDPEFHPMTLSMKLHDSGQVEWRFFDMDYDQFYGDLFSGAFDGALGQEFEIEGGTTSLTGTEVYRRFVMNAPADIWVLANAQQDPIEVGENATFEIRVGNLGPKEALDVLLTDTLPSGSTFISAVASQGSCSASAGVANCNLGTIAVGAEATVTVVMRADISGILETQARVSTSDFDNDTNNDESIAYVDVTPKPTDAELELSMTDVADPVAVGGQVEYVLNVINHGLGEASGVTITDALPSLTLVSATPDQGTCREGNGILTCELGDLAAGEELNVSIVLAADTVGPYTNEATVTGFANDPNPFNNTATEDTTVSPEGADGGVSPDSGAVADGGSADGGVDGGTNPNPDDGGCGCTAVGSRSDDSPALALGVALFLLLARRRRR